MTMKIHADFTQRIVVRPQDYSWVDSPMVGVQRMMLDRIGHEVARATSLVRYAPNTIFSSHTHTGGEEFMVLEGVFGDEYGKYPKGTYIRNPIGTSHTPQVDDQGALIFVKLQQFDASDNTPVCIHTMTHIWHQGSVKGLEVMPLHTYKTEHIALVKWAPNTQFTAHRHFGGEEIFVLEGTFYDEHGVYPKGSWIRSPHLSEHQPYTKDDGALIYVKVGHLNTITEHVFT